MDPKPAQILDPKLKEAYDRVMNTSVQPAKAAEPPLPPQPEQHAVTHDAPIAPEKHDEPQATVTQPPIQQSNPAVTHTPIASSAFIAPHETKKSPVSGKILVVAGVIFLIVYTLFWLKWFGVAIPFLP